MCLGGLLKTLTVIKEQNRGLFVGLYSNMAIFSKNDVMESTKAFGFNSQEEAEIFVSKYLPIISKTVEYIDIPSQELTYVSATDLIKAGYPELAEEFLLNMETPNTIH